jgi:hypothetical protein
MPFQIGHSAAVDKVMDLVTDDCVMCLEGRVMRAVSIVQLRTTAPKKQHFYPKNRAVSSRGVRTAQSRCPAIPTLPRSRNMRAACGIYGSMC